MLRMRAWIWSEDAGLPPLKPSMRRCAGDPGNPAPTFLKMLFTDIQMPGSMDGTQLAYAVHQRWPLIKIILVSGQLN